MGQCTRALVPVVHYHWYHGTRVLLHMYHLPWYMCTTCHGTMVLEYHTQWYHGTYNIISKTTWKYSTMVVRTHVRWYYHGSTSNTMVPMVPYGTMVPCTVHVWTYTYVQVWHYLTWNTSTQVRTIGTRVRTYSSRSASVRTHVPYGTQTNTPTLSLPLPQRTCVQI